MPERKKPTLEQTKHLHRTVIEFFMDSPAKGNMGERQVRNNITRAKLRRNDRLSLNPDKLLHQLNDDEIDLLDVAKDRIEAALLASGRNIRDKFSNHMSRCISEFKNEKVSFADSIQPSQLEQEAEESDLIVSPNSLFSNRSKIYDAVQKSAGVDILRKRVSNAVDEVLDNSLSAKAKGSLEYGFSSGEKEVSVDKLVNDLINHQDLSHVFKVDDENNRNNADKLRKAVKALFE